MAGAAVPSGGDSGHCQANLKHPFVYKQIDRSKWRKGATSYLHNAVINMSVRGRVTRVSQ